MTTRYTIGQRSKRTAFSVARFPAVLALLLIATSLQAKVIRVPSGEILTLQQAVDAAAPGDTIIVRPGTYSNPDVGQYWPPIVYIGPDKSGLTLRASGPPGSVEVVGPGIGRGFLIAADNVLVTGFDISGLDTGIFGSGLGTQITGNWIHDCAIDCIHVGGSSAWEIDHNTLDGAERGVFLNGNGELAPGANIGHRVHRNLVTNATDRGIFVWNSPSCAINDNGVSNCELYGIHLASSPMCTADDNEAINNGDTGIFLGESPNCTLANNQSDNNGLRGITVGDSCGSVLQRNSAIGNGEFDLFSPDWGSPSCHTFRKNDADTAWPSLELWDIR
jgi:nitrous oxidase accessory protein